MTFNIGIVCVGLWEICFNSTMIKHCQLPFYFPVYATILTPYCAFPFLLPHLIVCPFFPGFTINCLLFPIIWLHKTEVLKLPLTLSKGIFPV